jgi:glycosyltransferase involved in cell wall biosynthesis
MKSITVITLTLNEEKNIRECLESVSWASERLVIDSGSTDSTVAIARACGATVLNVPWEGYGRTKNKGLDAADGDWILWLDADERVTPDLSEEIQDVLKRQGSDPAGFTIARRAYFLGRWIRHAGWYPGRVLRLFQRKQGRFTDLRVHEGVTVEGPIGSLRHDLVHMTDPSLNHYFVKFNRYTTLAAEELREKGRQFHIADLLVRPLFTFFRMYIFRQGFLDGIQGLILCAVSACYVFVKYAKLWELENASFKEAKS